MSVSFKVTFVNFYVITMFEYFIVLLLICSQGVYATDGLAFGNFLALILGIGISLVGIFACLGYYARRRASGFDSFFKMQREEKQLEAALEAIVMRVNDLKNSIAAMIYKIENEYENSNWPTFLDNYALLSSQLTSLSKMLTHDKSPPLRSLTVLPLLLSQERDEDLLRLTEHRIPAFAHDIVPDYLRSKPEPEVESKMIQLEHKAANLSYEAAQKQTAAYTKVVNHIWEIVSKAREEWESEGSSRGGSAQTSSVQDTHTLVAAVALGKGLKMMPQGVQPGSQGMMMAPMGRPGSGGPPGQPGSGPGPMNPNQQQMGQVGKAPSGIKTNIKAATQIHPYGR